MGFGRGSGNWGSLHVLLGVDNYRDETNAAYWTHMQTQEGI